MAKVKKHKGPSFGTPDEELDIKQIAVKRRGLEPPSSVTLYFDCPFCAHEVKAYLWSISGGGKRCDCGALFGGNGRAIHFKNTKEG